MSVYTPLQLRRPDFPADLINILPSNDWFRNDARLNQRPGYLQRPPEAYHIHLNSPLQLIGCVAIRKVARLALDHLSYAPSRDQNIKPNEYQEIEENPLDTTIGPDERDDHVQLFSFKMHHSLLDHALGQPGSILFSSTQPSMAYKFTTLALKSGRRPKSLPVLFGKKFAPLTVLKFDHVARK